eukprot:TRINITY_DN75699_c0_g1_i1.p1 TRINITY_DN75699_c0_g1~~TRINITY_DN75699_c0_g1_i1.p1  ORF type:complete len:487 (-),score=45.35 TRINITY_DN75699_c0_g1_i1:48-1508(-)
MDSAQPGAVEPQLGQNSNNSSVDDLWRGLAYVFEEGIRKGPEEWKSTWPAETVSQHTVMLTIEDSHDSESIPPRWRETALIALQKVKTLEEDRWGDCPGQWRVGDRFQLTQDDAELCRLCKMVNIEYQGGFAFGWTGKITSVVSALQAVVNYDIKPDNIQDWIPLEAATRIVVAQGLHDNYAFFLERRLTINQQPVTRCWIADTMFFQSFSGTSPAVTDIKSALPQSAPLSVKAAAGRDEGILDDLTCTDYQPLAKFVTDFKPTKRVASYVKEDMMQHDGFRKRTGRFIDSLIAETWKVTQDKMRNFTGFHEDEVFAVVLFTMQLQNFELNAEAADEFYARYNASLRQRQNRVTKQIAGYSHFLMKALQRVPVYSGLLWRGIEGQEAVELAKQRYLKGYKIHWSAFSSASTARSVAVDEFAGQGGLVFEIDVVDCARDVSRFSAIAREEERLILPNTAFIVVKGVHEASDNVWQINLLQTQGGFVF